MVDGYTSRFCRPCKKGDNLSGIVFAFVAVTGIFQCLRGNIGDYPKVTKNLHYVRTK